MPIQITRPEIESLIEQRLRSGVFATVDDILLDALETQRDQERWLAEERLVIQEKIDRGLAQLDRGEGISEQDLRASLAARRGAWLAERSSR
jgi:hypothetical protein